MPKRIKASKPASPTEMLTFRRIRRDLEENPDDPVDEGPSLAETDPEGWARLQATLADMDLPF